MNGYNTYSKSSWVKIILCLFYSVPRLDKCIGILIYFIFLIFACLFIGVNINKSVDIYIYMLFYPNFIHTFTIYILLLFPRLFCIYIYHYCY